MTENKRIFTFWEPSHKMPAYIRLCIQTWKKFLPEYEVIILDYSNIDKWIEPNFYDKILYTDFTLPKQADAIRCAVLSKHGGIWMDADTIITSEKIKNIINIDSDFVLLSKHICFIVAKKNSYILKKWQNGIKYNLKKYSFIKNIGFLYKIFCKNIERWDYLGNYILKKFLKTKNKNIFYSINKFEIGAFPEFKINTTENKSLSDIYREFYFENDYADNTLKNTNGIICLHNSWTPTQYILMDEQTFLSQNNTLANILKYCNN